MKEVARAVIINEDGHILLGRRSQNSTAGAGKYSFVGGKLDPGEEAKDAVIREVFEETGLRFTSIAYLVRVDETSFPNDPWRVHYFYGKAEGELKLDPEEIDDVVYVNPNTLDNYEIAFDQRDRLLEFFEAQKTG